MSNAMTPVVILACALAAASATAGAEQITVSRAAWEGLTGDERAAIQAVRVVSLRENDSYGLVVDNQGVDESRSGTTAGAQLGSTVAQAAYIDRAFRGGNNYSALGQVGIGILGAMIGSAADRPAVQQYHFRYALKRSNGEIASVDSVQSSPFRHPAGFCLGLPDLQPIPQSVCNYSSDDLRRVHLSAKPISTPMPAVPVAVAAPPATAAASQDTGRVQCKVGTQGPFSTVADLCKAIGGNVL